MIDLSASAFAGQMAVHCDLAVVQSNYFGSVPKPTESLKRHVTWCNFISFQINFKLAYIILHFGLFCILHSFLNIHHLLHPHNWPKLVNSCWLGEREKERWASGLPFFWSLWPIFCQYLCMFTLLCLYSGWSNWFKLAFTVINAESKHDCNGAGLVP